MTRLPPVLSPQYQAPFDSTRLYPCTLYTRKKDPGTSTKNSRRQRRRTSRGRLTMARYTLTAEKPTRLIADCPTGNWGCAGLSRTPCAQCTVSAHETLGIFFDVHCLLFRLRPEELRCLHRNTLYHLLVGPAGKACLPCPGRKAIAVIHEGSIADDEQHKYPQETSELSHNTDEVHQNDILAMV